MKATIETLKEAYKLAFKLNLIEGLDGLECCQKVLEAARCVAIEIYGDNLGDEIHDCVVAATDPDCIEIFAEEKAQAIVERKQEREFCEECDEWADRCECAAQEYFAETYEKMDIDTYHIQKRPTQ